MDDSIRSKERTYRATGVQDEAYRRGRCRTGVHAPASYDGDPCIDTFERPAGRRVSYQCYWCGVWVEKYYWADIEEVVRWNRFHDDDLPLR